MLAQLPEIYLLRKQFGIVKENIDSSFNKIFYILTSDLDLTTRSKNILQIENLKYVGDLIQYSENSLSKLTNMGSKCIYEIKREVNKLGLELDTQLENWPPAELEEIQKQKKQFYTTKLKLNFDQLNFLTKNIRDINLSVRVSNGLLNIGCNTISDLLVISKSELLRSRNFGKKSLSEIQNLLNKYNLELTDSLEPWSDEILKNIRNTIDSEIIRKKNEISKSEDKYLEDELKRVCTDIFSKSLRRTDLSNNRLLEIFMSRYGLDNSPPKTLELIGQKFNITRERVRQLQKQAEKLIKKSDVFLPLLVKFFLILKEQIPCTENHINKLFQKLGFSNFYFKIFSLFQVSKLFSISYPKVKIINKNGVDILCDYEKKISLDPILLIINKNISTSGVSSIDSIKNRHQFYLNNLSENIITTLIKNFKNFVWLDEEKNWFTFFSKRNRLVNLIIKLATHSSEIKLDALYLAVNKNYRLKKDLKLPKEQFLNFCKHAFDVEYVQDTKTIIFKSLISKISSTQGRMGQHLSEKEKILISVFKNYGPILLWEDMFELLNRHGVGSAHISQFTQFSPLIERIDHATYALTGSDFKNTKSEVKTIKIELTTNSFPISDCEYVKNNQAYVEIYKNRKYLKTLLYARPLRIIEDNIFGINYDGKIYPIVS